MIADFCSLVKANRGRENRGKEKRINTRKDYDSEVNSIARRGQGGIPLAGSRDSVPCRAWGNAPTVGRVTYSKGKVKHGTLVAGSEASLRSNSRSRRSGIPHPRKKSTMVVCAAKGSRGRPQTSSVSIAPLSPPQRRNPCVNKHKIIKKSENQRKKRTLPSQTSTNLEVLFHHERYHHA